MYVANIQAGWRKKKVYHSFWERRQIVYEDEKISKEIGKESNEGQRIIESGMEAVSCN